MELFGYDFISFQLYDRKMLIKYEGNYVKVSSIGFVVLVNILVTYIIIIVITQNYTGMKGTFFPVNVVF